MTTGPLGTILGTHLGILGTTSVPVRGRTGQPPYKGLSLSPEREAVPNPQAQASSAEAVHAHAPASRLGGADG